MIPIPAGREGLAPDWLQLQPRAMAESSSSFEPTDPVDPSVTGTPEGGNDSASPEAKPHNFDVQKELHRRIRNDPDYDDWEYGTEPLPHELGGWVAKKPAAE